MVLVNFPDMCYTNAKFRVGRLIPLTAYTKTKILYRSTRYDGTYQYTIISLSNFNHDNTYDVLEEW